MLERLEQLEIDRLQWQGEKAGATAIPFGQQAQQQFRIRFDEGTLDTVVQKEFIGVENERGR